jgi:hypothetical protein
MDKNLLGYKGVKPVFLIVGFLTLVQSLSILLLAKWLAEVVSALFAGAPLKEQWGYFPVVPSCVSGAPCVRPADEPHILPLRGSYRQQHTETNDGQAVPAGTEAGR